MTAEGEFPPKKEECGCRKSTTQQSDPDRRETGYQSRLLKHRSDRTGVRSYNDRQQGEGRNSQDGGDELCGNSTGKKGSRRGRAGQTSLLMDQRP